MSEELPGGEIHITQNEDTASSHLSKELQKLLFLRPEMQEWRDKIITEQQKSWEQEEQKYSSLSTPENLSRFFGSLPHTTTGWMIRTLSPENALLQTNTTTHLEPKQRSYVIIDPFRIGSLWKQHGSFALREVRNKDDMAQMIAAVRDWLLHAQPMLSGRVILGWDGRIGRFQEIKKAAIGWTSKKNPKLVPSNRAYLTMHGTMYGLLNSQQYARNHLDQGERTIKNIKSEVAQLIAHCVEKKPAPPELASANSTIQELVSKIRSQVEVRWSFFYLEKMMIDYLLKLNWGQYDSTRVYWAAKTLQAWLRDRIGKSASIKEQVILLELAKNVELYHWKQAICGEKTWKIDIFEILEDISRDFPAFIAQISHYVPLRDAAIFNPFFSFYREWQAFAAENPDNSQEAQQKVARQYILLTLQEIKTRYAYHGDMRPGEITSLKNRITILEKLREKFFSEKPEISLDFWAEKTTINEILKKEIARYK